MRAHAPVLAVSGVRYAWPRRAWTLRVPELVLDAGETVFLHGPSGSGKSTLLNLVAGTLRPQSGTIALLGEDMAARSGLRRDRLRADHVGVIFQQFNLLPFLSLVENVLLPCRFSARRRARAIERHGSLDAAASTLLAHLGLDDPALRHAPVMTLSVGQQQRAAAARAVVGGPELVIADEPTSALDADARDAFLSLLFAECAAAGAALLFVSHDLALAARFGRSASLTDLIARADAAEAA